MKKAFALAAMVLSLAACSKVTKENYDKLEVGMPYNDVVSLIGKPDKCDDTLGVTNCIWGDNAKHIKVAFVADKATIYSGKGIN
ncbi:hypothetical protein NF212_00475 [Parasalinivibrio latis]|uniref:hypothetical protein n=1 Tax=Parasalinivibrio latis TaxID=2952610 RepID=UPI0030E0F547